jgi:tetratricopeptide (TPR) repeat protein
MPDVSPKYWAFLSYSHADSEWAERLHRWLENFVVPRRLVGHPTLAGPAPRRFRPVFRDREELRASANLGERLTTALGNSAYLIVLCSPSAAQSAWVEEEVRQFKALHGEDRVLALIVSGTPNAVAVGADADLECFPLALRRRVSADGSVSDIEIQHSAADVRPGKDGPRRARLKLLSGMLQVDLDELVHRVARRRIEQSLALAAAAVAIAAIMTGLALNALVQRNRALAERGQAEGLIEFMIGDLRKKLEPAGRLDALDAVGNRALGYYAAQQSIGIDDESLGRRSRVLHLLGEIRDRRGDLAAASKFFEEASRATQALLARQPNDGQRVFDHAQSVYWVGYIAWRRGKTDDALQQFREYQRLADRLVAIDPKNDAWRAEVGYANSNLGTVLLGDGQANDAARAFARTLEVSQALARDAPLDSDRQLELGQAYAWLGDAELMRGDLNASLAARGAERAIYERALSRAAGDNAAIVALAVNRTAVARVFIAEGRLPEAIYSLRAATADMDRIVEASPDDLSFQEKAAPMLELLGEALLMQGKLDAAASVADHSLSSVEVLTAKDATVFDWRGPYLGAARVLSIRVAAARSATPAELERALRPADAEAIRLRSLLALRPHNLALARSAAEAFLLDGDYQSLAGRPDAARSAWDSAFEALGSANALSLPPSNRINGVVLQLSLRRSSANSSGQAQPKPGRRSAAYNSKAASRPFAYRW